MDKVRIGVFGAFRGMMLIRAILSLESAEITAVCDKSSFMLDRCRSLIAERGLNITLYHDFEDFFSHPMDAVILANYANEHAPYAIRFLESGRHVLSEVLPFETMGQAVALAEAVNKSGMIYAYAENYCYLPSTLTMKERYQRGDIGTFMHGECEYIHDLSELWPMITYGDKNHWRNRMYSTYYCTHSMGPLIHITGARPAKIIGFEIPNAGYMADVGYPCGTAGLIVAQMDNGATVKAMNGFLRRCPSLWCAVYGTAGMMENDRWKLAESVYQYTPGQEVGFSSCIAGDDPPADVSSNRLTTGNFIRKILGDQSADTIDIYEAMDMALPGILAYRSICNGNQPVAMPDFRLADDREKYRNDNWCSNPDVAGSDLAPLCSFGSPEIPDSVYRVVQEKARQLLDGS